CSGAATGAAKAPEQLVERLGQECSAPAKMKPVGAMLRGRQADRDPHQEQTFHAEANRCYRVYLAGDEGVRQLVAVLRASAGAIIAEGRAPAVPEDGAVCFTAADDVQLLVGVGSGKGAWAARVYGD